MRLYGPDIRQYNGKVEFVVDWTWPSTFLVGYQYGHNGPNTAHWFSISLGFLEFGWGW